MSLDASLLTRFCADIETVDPTVLWKALERTYGGTQGTNAVFI
jgi:hypothetical protein